MRILVFGKQNYKGKQKEIVEAAVQGVDVFVSAPTGMGKVIIFTQELSTIH
jgi:bloom syndrome protein